MPQHINTPISIRYVSDDIIQHHIAYTARLNHCTHQLVPFSLSFPPSLSLSLSSYIYMYMYTCIYIYRYVCVYVCMSCVCIYIYIYMFVCLFVCTYNSCWYIVHILSQLQPETPVHRQKMPSHTITRTPHTTHVTHHTHASSHTHTHKNTITHEDTLTRAVKPQFM